MIDIPGLGEGGAPYKGVTNRLRIRYADVLDALKGEPLNASVNQAIAILMGAVIDLQSQVDQLHADLAGLG